MGKTWGRRAVRAINADEYDYLGTDLAAHHRGQRSRRSAKRSYRRRERRFLNRWFD